MIFLNPARSKKRLRDLQRPATIEPGINYTHAPQVWALGFTGQTLLLPVPILAFAGRITRLSLTIAAGTDRTPITITTGTIPFTTAPAILR